MVVLRNLRDRYSFAVVMELVDMRDNDSLSGKERGKVGIYPGVTGAIELRHERCFRISNCKRKRSSRKLS